MTINPVLLTIWAVLGACFLALLVYRGQLTRYEDEQLFLNEDVETPSQAEHDEIVSRLDRITPIFNFFAGVTVLMTASVVGLYVWNAWKVIH